MSLSPVRSSKDFVHTFDGWQMFCPATNSYVDVDFDNTEMKIEFSFFIACRMARQFEMD